MRSISRSLSYFALVALAATSAQAQNFNIDVGTQPVFAPIPTTAYPAAAGQNGLWNAVPPVLPAPVPINDVTGAPTGATLGNTGGIGPFNFNNPSTIGDDGALLDDCQNIGGLGTTTTWTFSGLASGEYRLFTYAWAPDNAAFQSTVTGGTISPSQTVGGPWTGIHQQGITYALHHFVVSGGGQIAITISTTNGFGSLNGFQVVRVPPPGAYVCFGDGSGSPCPTGNNRAVVQQAGCLNSTGAGAIIEATGNPSISNDTIQFQGSFMTFGSCLYFQGNNLIGGGTGVLFGDGILCVNQQVVRLAIKQNMHGSSAYPEPGDNPVSQQGGVSTPGFRYYEVWYRDAAPFGSPSTFNTSRTVCIPWVP